MINNCLTVFLLAINLYSCKPQVIKDNNKSYFKDFDFFKMEGIDKISNLSYPYVEIQKKEDSILIINYFYESGCNKLETYKKVDDYWISQSTIQEDKLIYFDQYINQNKIYVIEYYKTEKYTYLTYLRILEKEKVNYIILQNDYLYPDSTIYKKELPWHLKYDNWDRHGFYKTIVKNDRFYEFSTNINIDGTMIKNENCIYLGSYPYNFYNFFPNKFRQLDCNE